MSALLQLLITQSGHGGGAKEDALLAVAILVEGTRTYKQKTFGYHEQYFSCNDYTTVEAQGV